MKIAIVNDIHVGRPLTHDGKVRASSHLVEDRLKPFLERIVQLHAPDLLVNLGDLIRSEGEEKDYTRYTELLAVFSQLQCPLLHMLGNHEVKRMTEKQLEQAWLRHGLHQKSFGSQIVKGYRLLWLGLSLDPKDRSVCFLPQEQVEWLQECLKESTYPTFIFSHCPIDDHDTTGNFFYEAMDNRSKKTLFLQNQAAVRSSITASTHVKAVFQAHLHYFHIKQIGKIPYFTCPAMGDNICGPQVEDNVPEIYTIITCDENKLTVKVFSREYCFAGYESCLA